MGDNRIRTLRNKYLRGYIDFGGDLIATLSAGYCFYAWIQTKIDIANRTDRNHFFIYNKEANNSDYKSFLIDMGGVKFERDEGDDKNIKKVVKWLSDHKEFIQKPFNDDYGSSKMTDRCVLNMASKKYEVSFVLVSEFAYININKSSADKFNIILYKDDNRYFVGLSSTFNYNDIASYKESREELYISDYSDEATFHAIVSAISNEPLFVRSLDRRDLENIKYYLNYKAKNNLYIQKKVKKLKDILEKPDRNCRNHNREMVYPCGRQHCIQCVDLSNANTMVHKCPCGKISRMQQKIFCASCKSELMPNHDIKCNNSHYFCQSCLISNSNNCYICYNFRCIHGVYIKQGFVVGRNDNISIDCASCTNTIKLK